MLKLMKYELIHSLRTFITSFGIFLVACILLPFMMNSDRLDDMPIISMFMIFGFSFLVVGITIALFVSVFMNYNQSMFKKPGYLTLTLPVTTTQLIVSKVLVTIVWLIISWFVLLGGMMLLTLVTSWLNDALTVSLLIDSIKEFLTSVGQYIYTMDFFKEVFTVISLLLFVVSSIYFSLTLTHTKLVKNHRVLIGTILFFVFIFIIQFILSFFFKDVGYIDVRNPMVVFEMFIYLCIGILLTWGTIYIIDHHIEVE